MLSVSKLLKSNVKRTVHSYVTTYNVWYFSKSSQTNIFAMPRLAKGSQLRDTLYSCFNLSH